MKKCTASSPEESPVSCSLTPDLMGVGRTLIPRIVMGLGYPYPVYDNKVSVQFSAIAVELDLGVTHEKKAGIAFGVESS